MQKYTFCGKKEYFCKLIKDYFSMACILNIETSTEVCSVVVVDEGHVIWNEEEHSGPNHAVTLGVYVDQALSYIDNDGLHLDAVAVSSGPGSYTGLRIGVSTAKGVCYGRDAKLIAIPTLQAMCVPLLLGEKIEEDALLCPMLDARRMEVYAQFFDRALNSVRDVQADIIDENSYKDILNNKSVYFFGPGAAKCKDVIKHPNAHFIDGIEPLAADMAPLATKRFFKEEFEDVAYFVPFYLKDFQTSQPKKLI